MDQIWSEREERRGTFGPTKWGSNHPPRVVRLTSTVGHHPFAQGAVSSPIVVKVADVERGSVQHERKVDLRAASVGRKDKSSA